jgi:hypothetical protein
VELSMACEPGSEDEDLESVDSEDDEKMHEYE